MVAELSGALTVTITTRRSARCEQFLSVCEALARPDLDHLPVRPLVTRLDDLMDGEGFILAQPAPDDDLCLIIDLTPAAADWLADLLAALPVDIAKTFAPPADPAATNSIGGL